MTRFPEGIPNWNFLINEDNIRFKGAFLRWLIVERMGKLILTLGGFFIFVLGILKKPENKENFFYFSFLASAVLYFTVFASVNIRHDYYQVPFVPVAAIFMAIGTKTLLNLPAAHFNKMIGPIIAIAAILSIFAFGFYEIKGYYWINKPQIVKAGEAVDRLLPKNAIVIAGGKSDLVTVAQNLKNPMDRR